MSINRFHKIAIPRGLYGIRSRLTSGFALALWVWLGAGEVMAAGDNPELLALPNSHSTAQLDAGVATEKDATPIELVVVMVVDQLRADRLQNEMKGGLGSLRRLGKDFSQAELQHAVSTTCPGHAVVLTGVHPGRAGMPDNSYLDAAKWQGVYCVQDADSPVLGHTAELLAQDEDSDDVLGRSPVRLRVPTLGTWLKQAHPAARVISIGAKDRATIVLGGHQADVALWFDRRLGQFTTSTYYKEQIPTWVQQVNGVVDPEGMPQLLAELPAKWEHPVDGVRPDNFAGEDDTYSAVSGHPLDQPEVSERAEALYASPYMDELVMNLASAALTAENLLNNQQPDLLAISLAATDTVGHRYGPFSSESADTLNRLDQRIGQFLDLLDEQGDMRKVLVVLTADHGVAPLPEWSLAQGTSTCPESDGRISPMGLFTGLYWSLYWNFTAPFGKPWDLVTLGGSMLYVNRDPAVLGDHSVSEVVDHLVEYFEAEDFVRRAWRASELQDLAAQPNPGEALRYLRSYDRERSGDLILQVEPGCIVGMDQGTTHGSPYAYDARIPLLFFGHGVTPGVSNLPAGSVDIAPTLVDLLNLPFPEDLDGKVLPLD